MRRARSVRPPWRLPRSAPEVVKAARRISESFPNGVGDDFDHACICSISPQCAGPGLFSGHRTRRAEQTWGRCFPYVLRAPEGWSQGTLIAAAWPSSRANNPCLMASGVPFPEMEEARVLADHSVLAAPTNFPPYGDSATARSSAVEGAPCSLNGSARPGCPAKPNARGSVSGRRRHPRKSHRDRAGLGSDGAMATIHAFGPFRLDADAEILFRGSDPLPVGKRAVAVLRVLVERAGAPVSKDTLIDAAWAGWRSRRAISQCKLPHCVGHSARCPAEQIG